MSHWKCSGIRWTRSSTSTAGLPGRSATRTTSSTKLNREIIGELLLVMKDSPQFIEPALQLFSTSRHIERIADHATNIAEDVVYLVEGDIIRHRAEFGTVTGSQTTLPGRLQHRGANDSEPLQMHDRFRREPLFGAEVAVNAVTTGKTPPLAGASDALGTESRRCDDSRQ